MGYHRLELPVLVNVPCLGTYIHEAEPGSEEFHYSARIGHCHVICNCVRANCLKDVAAFDCSNEPRDSWMVRCDSLSWHPPTHQNPMAGHRPDRNVARQINHRTKNCTRVGDRADTECNLTRADRVNSNVLPLNRMTIPRTATVLVVVLLLEAGLVISLRWLGWYGTGNAIKFAACLVVTFFPLLVACVLLIRRRLKFSVRTLLVATTLVAVFPRAITHATRAASRRAPHQHATFGCKRYD